MSDTIESPTLQKLCIQLYGIYALSAVLQFFEETFLVGLLALTIAYIIGNSKKEAAKNTPYASHLRWMYRTLWIGSLVIIPAGLLIGAVLVFIFTDTSMITGTLDNGDPDVAMGGIQGYLAHNMTKITILTTITTIPTAAWWINRCWVGYVLAKDGKPVENVTRWR